MLAYSGLYLPFKRTRAAVYIALTLSSIIAGASCVNAIKKLRTHKTQIKMVLEGDQAISIDNADIENAGILLFVVGMLLSMQVGNFLLMLIKDWFKPEWPPSFMQPRNGVAMSTSTLRAQSWYLLVNTLAILAVFIPAAHFTANGSFKIGATSAGAPVSESDIASQLAALGLGLRYWSFEPIRFEIVSNGLNLLVAVVATVVSFVADRQRVVRGVDLAEDKVMDKSEMDRVAQSIAS